MKKLLLLSALGAVMVCAPAFAQDGAGETPTHDETFSQDVGGGPARPNPEPIAPQRKITDSIGGFYVSGNAGLNYTADADNTGPGLNVESNHDKGFQFAGALGLRFSRDFRVETEISYRQNDLDSLTVSSAGGPQTGLTANASGDVTSTSLMLNLYGDMDVFADNRGMNLIKPYIMGGIGMTHVSADISGGGVKLVDDDDYAFAYQIGVGFGYAFTESTFLDIGYRYHATSDLEFNAANNGPQFDTDYNNHTFLVGLRHEFNKK